MKRKYFCSLTIYITEICDSFCWCYLIRVEHFFTYLVVVYILMTLRKWNSASYTQEMDFKQIAELHVSVLFIHSLETNLCKINSALVPYSGQSS